MSFLVWPQVWDAISSKRLLKQHRSRRPQEAADAALRTALRAAGGVLSDDMSLCLVDILPQVRGQSHAVLTICPPVHVPRQDGACHAGCRTLCKMARPTGFVKLAARLHVAGKLSLLCAAVLPSRVWHKRSCLVGTSS